jgi:hypothetical protein
MVAVSTLPVGHPWRADGLDEARVVEVAGSIGQLAPIVVRRIDRLVVDGAHRVAAARRLGIHALAVTWFDGDALEVAQAFIGLNGGCGLPVTGRDREALVRWVLAIEPMWSDRRLAWSCGVSPKTVARHRRERVPGGGDIERRVGRDGRVRPARAGAVRAQVAEALEQDPEASLRAIASKVGVSPETVRSVRRSQGSAAGPGRVATALARVPDPVVRPAQDPGAVLAPWHGDPAFESTDAGISFVEWFDTTDVESTCWGRAEEVPLGRVYEIADEARRRATFWSSFAKELEARARPQGSGQRRA